MRHPLPLPYPSLLYAYAVRSARLKSASVNLPLARMELSMFFRKFLASAGTDSRKCGHLADVLRDVLERLHRRRSDLHRGHRGSAGDHDVETHDVGETVVERQDDQRAEMRRNVDPRQRLLDVGRVVAVGQDHAFGV